MTVTAPPSGVYTPVPTFVKPANSRGRYELDIETQVKHAIFLKENGIKGIVLLGSTGEMVHLTRAERVRLVEGVVKGLAAKGHEDFAVYAGVAHDGIDDTLEEIEALKKAGASHAMVLAPNYFAKRSTEEGILSWFKTVADESVLPVVIYYFPGVSNNLEISPTTLVKLSGHHNIVGVKLSHGDVSQYAQLALDEQVQKNNFTVLTGLGQVLLPAVTVGITATIDAISGAYPKSLVKLLELSLEGKIKEAQKIQYLVSKASQVIVAHGPVGAKYAIVRALGWSSDNAYCRPPLNETLTISQSNKYDPDLDALAKLEKSL